MYVEFVPGCREKKTRMSSSRFRTGVLFSFAVTMLVAAGIGKQAWGQAGSHDSSQPSTAKGDWPSDLGDVEGTRYSPLDQINASNFSQLTVAWRFKTDNMGPRPEYKLEGTPLEINGTLYTTAGTRRDVVALDAKTGELKWVYGLDEGARAQASPRQLSGRGVGYWTDGNGDERIVYVTIGYQLIELNAKTGQPIESFGRHGIVDMKVGAYTGTGQQIDLVTGEIGLHTAPVVSHNIIVVGSAFKDGGQPVTHNNTKGLVRGYDVRTGKMIWQFNPVPKKGEFGYDTWLNGSADVNGNTGIWAGITIDPELGLVYLPVEQPTNDSYGGSRPGNTLFANSLVCLDLYTGKRKWYYQIVHHDLWDFDISAPPILTDIVVDGKPIKAVAVPTKESYLFVFDRVTGKPVWPIEEQAAPRGDIPGEWYSPTEPVPTKPPAYGRTAVTDDELIDFTPQLHQKALDLASHYKYGSRFQPPVVSKSEGPFAALEMSSSTGGTNWTGAAYDPEEHIVFAPAVNQAILVGLIAPPSGFSDMAYLTGMAGQTFRITGGAGGGYEEAQKKLQTLLAQQPSAAPAANAFRPTNQVDGLPMIKPPYGVLSAIDLDKGDLLWSVPHGDTPDAVRNNPALKGMNIPKTGQTGNVGPMVTKSLVVMGDPQVTTTLDHPRGAMLRAYDKKTGQQVGAVLLPAQQTGAAPMTYMLDGKQYIVVAVGGGNYSGEYIAFTLPASN
jgi:quinoprotein glucose dehydrogenase